MGRHPIPPTHQALSRTSTQIRLLQIPYERLNFVCRGSKEEFVQLMKKSLMAEQLYAEGVGPSQKIEDIGCIWDDGWVWSDPTREMTLLILHDLKIYTEQFWIFCLVVTWIAKPCVSTLTSDGEDIPIAGTQDAEDLYEALLIHQQVCRLTLGALVSKCLVKSEGGFLPTWIEVCH